MTRCLLFALLAFSVPAAFAETPVDLQNARIVDVQPKTAFPETYEGFQTKKDEFPIDMEAGLEFNVIRDAAICPRLPVNGDQRVFSSAGLGLENFYRVGRLDVTLQTEKQYIDYEMCVRATVGQKLKVVRLSILSLGCTPPFIPVSKRDKNPLVQHACFYFPVVEFMGQEQMITSDALEGFDEYAVSQLRKHVTGM